MNQDTDIRRFNLEVINRYLLRWADQAISHDRRLCIVYEDQYGNCHRTATIVRHEGRRIKTADGGTYILGNPYPVYVEWMQCNFHEFDENNPLDFKLSGKFVPVLGPDEDRENPYYSLFHQEKTGSEDHTDADPS
jgi:hypothetical protein